VSEGPDADPLVDVLCCLLDYPLLEQHGFADPVLEVEISVIDLSAKGGPQSPFKVPLRQPELLQEKPLRFY